MATHPAPHLISSHLPGSQRARPQASAVNPPPPSESCLHVGPETSLQRPPCCLSLARVLNSQCLCHTVVCLSVRLSVCLSLFMGLMTLLINSSPNNPSQLSLLKPHLGEVSASPIFSRPPYDSSRNFYLNLTPDLAHPGPDQSPSLFVPTID